ncbi:hypothetical protein BJF90_45375 [Pseudonocardia sp. CNS-004]|nr:hypothetical protein BJF90_45375 [Pseudonocardia sp. CNS-004]
MASSARAGSGNAAPSSVGSAPVGVRRSSVAARSVSSFAIRVETARDVPVHVRVGERRFALDVYPVAATAALVGELKGVPGIAVQQATYAGERGSGDRRTRVAG